MSVDQPAWLLLLPLALLPWLAPAGRPLLNTWAALLPPDRPSQWLQRALRAAATLALVALVLSLTGPHLPEAAVQRVGQGAEIVLVLDRSRSMDERFAGARPDAKAPTGTGPEALAYYSRLRHSGSRETKGTVARQLLSDFARQRPEDRFGMVVFSSLPMRVLDFTQKPDIVQAAIQAASIGRGLSDTQIGPALLAALDYFDDRPYTGSRLLMLVSDGGDHLDVDARARIEHLVRKHRVGVVWLYLRAAGSPGLMLDSAEPPANADTVPEYFLHRFFQGMNTPYRAYEAENPEALKKAIDEVNRLENLPITYLDTLPRRDLAPWCHAAALACVLLLLGANLASLERAP